MGDDAEYYMEQQEEEARYKQLSEYAALYDNGKPLLCWADGVGYEDEIWSWEPLDKVLGIFSTLHKEGQIGSDRFLASSVPIVGNEADWDNEYASRLETNDLREIKLVGELKFYIANGEADATHEVIVLSRKDADLLKTEVVRPRWSREKRPCVVTSKPAIEVRPGRVVFTLSLSVCPSLFPLRCNL